jgi:hypothetical protein
MVCRPLLRPLQRPASARRPSLSHEQFIGRKNGWRDGEGEDAKEFNGFAQFFRLLKIITVLATVRLASGSAIPNGRDQIAIHS